MAYTKIEGYRIPYHLDGTRVGYNTSGFTSQPTTWITGAELSRWNSENNNSSIAGTAVAWYMVFFLPELMDITQLVGRMRRFSAGTGPIIDSFQGSADTQDGTDGTWLTPTVSGIYNKVDPPNGWWVTPATVSFVQPVKAVRIRFYMGLNGQYYFDNLHLYGTKAAGQTPDDIVFLQSDGVTPYTTIQWDGTLYEGTEKQTTIHLKNTSTSKTANNLALSTGGTNKADFSFSVDDGATFVTSATLPTLAPGATKKVVLKNKIGAASQALGPRNGSIDCVIGSWT